MKEVVECKLLPKVGEVVLLKRAGFPEIWGKIRVMLVRDRYVSGTFVETSTESGWRVGASAGMYWNESKEYIYIRLREV